MKSVESGERGVGCLVNTFNENFELVRDLQELYEGSLREYLAKLLEGRTRKKREKLSEELVEDIMVHAFNSLDNDLSREGTCK